jgi:hypothetical protein
MNEEESVFFHSDLVFKCRRKNFSVDLIGLKLSFLKDKASEASRVSSGCSCRSDDEVA